MRESNFKINLIAFSLLLLAGWQAEAKYEEKQFTRPDGSVYCRIYEDRYNGSGYYIEEGPCKHSPVPPPILEDQEEVVVCRLSSDQFVTIEKLRERDAILRVYQGSTLLTLDILSVIPGKNGIEYRSLSGSGSGMWIDLTLDGRGIQFGSKIISGHCL